MQKIRKWWGWILQENSETIGFVSNHGGETKWEAISADEVIIKSDINLRKDAIAIVLNHNAQEKQRQDSLFQEWVSANKILEQMTEQEFRSKVFTGEIHIVSMNLGQPRHSKIMGNGLFLLSRGF